LNIKGIHIDNIDLYKEYKILPESRSIGNPDKKKILEEIPFSNKVLDFSELYGEQTYSERTISYVLNLIGTQSTEQSAYFLQTVMTNLLMDKQQFRLYDDIFPNYYFLAEVRGGTSFAENSYAGKLQVDFICYPFKIKTAKEGSQLWDDYSILDYYQETSFSVNGTKTIKLMNNGISSVIPKVTASSSMVVTKENTTITFPIGTNESYDLVIDKGMNYLTITGNGTIDFEFHKEMI